MQSNADSFMSAFRRLEFLWKREIGNGGKEKEMRIWWKSTVPVINQINPLILNITISKYSWFFFLLGSSIGAVNACWRFSCLPNPGEFQSGHRYISFARIEFSMLYDHETTTYAVLWFDNVFNLKLLQDILIIIISKNQPQKISKEFANCLKRFTSIRPLEIG